MTRRPSRVALRSPSLVFSWPRRCSRWLRAVSVIVVLALVGTLLTPGSPASAEDILVDRDLAVADMLSGGPSLLAPRRRPCSAATRHAGVQRGGGRRPRRPTAGRRPGAGRHGQAVHAGRRAGRDGRGPRAQVQAFVSGGYRPSTGRRRARPGAGTWTATSACAPARPPSAALAPAPRGATSPWWPGWTRAQRADDRLAATQCAAAG